LNFTEDQRPDAPDESSGSIQLPIGELAAALRQRRQFLAIVLGIGILLAIGYALMLKNEYKSSAQLMPLDQQALSSPSALNSLTGSGLVVPSVTGSLIGGRTPGQTVIGILGSRTAQNDIINRFDLMRVYRTKFYSDARKKLARQTTATEDKKTGMVTIEVIDRDPVRARDMAGAYIQEIDKLLSAVSTSSARRERIFLDERIKEIKNDLDATSRQLSQFSSHNATLNPQVQGQALLEAAAKLQGELIASRSELSGLKSQYTDDNIRVRAAQARVDQLSGALGKMSGVGENADYADLKADQLYPSLRKLPLLEVTYIDLYHRLTMQEAIYETLTKQDELARVQEAKEIPAIKVLDEPDLPERKSSPHRAVIVLFGAFLSGMAGIVWVVGCWLRKSSVLGSFMKASGVGVSGSNLERAENVPAEVSELR
jgi:uncharacterized protein involved in exopolysaccharide biosynthesis